jgi:heat shock protein HtpX
MVWLISIAKFIITLFLLFLSSLVVKAFSRRREYHADKLPSLLINKKSKIYPLNCLKEETPTIPKSQMAYAAFKINSPKRAFGYFLYSSIH